MERKEEDMAAATNSVVIVDPSVTWRKRSCDALRANGYTVAGFASPGRAMEHLRKHSTDVVVADFTSVTKPLMTKWRKLVGRESRFVFLVRSRQPDVIAECFRYGADDCALRPPADGKMISDIVYRAINRSSGQLVSA